MILNEYIDSEFKKLLNTTDKIEVNNRKIDETIFNSLWNRTDPWVEKPNFRRDTSKESWSGVTKIQLNKHNFFLKKQQDYFAYSIKPPFKRMLLQREFESIKLFSSYKIPSLDIVYLGIRKNGCNTQGILITKSLDNYISLNEAKKQYLDLPGPKQHKIKRAAIASVTELVKKMHQSGLMHNYLYLKHIYIDKNFCKTEEKPANEPVCRFIDLEGARKATYNSTKQLRDLETLNRNHRHSPAFGLKQKIYFLLKYLNKTSCDKDVRNLIKRINKISK
jgi:hypothetical protein